MRLEAGYSHCALLTHGSIVRETLYDGCVHSTKKEKKSKDAKESESVPVTPTTA